jgi:choline dehydrogenase
VAADYDFIVVGSGPGGGPLACNLALHPKGYRVALLEAGIDPARLAGSRTFFNYSVPALHVRATEDPVISWQFFVQHYKDEKRQKLDSKYHVDERYKDNNGIFYPRAAAVGGCAAHHALVTLTPHNDDWKKLRELTGDDSWAPEKMRCYFERLEDCQYLPRTGPPTNRDAATGHGFGGWLPLSMPDPTVAVGDKNLLRILLRAFLVAELDAHPPGQAGAAVSDKGRAEQALGRLLQAADRAAQRLPNVAQGTLEEMKRELQQWYRDPQRKEEGDALALLTSYVHDAPRLLDLFRMSLAWLDPNRHFANDIDRQGAFSTPASVLHGTRVGLRERILEVRALYPDRLHLITGAVVTQVLFDKRGAGGVPLRAVGVEYLPRLGVYDATPEERWTNVPTAPRQLYVRDGGEVILAGGTFNTPQLLMLSGLGPRKDLEDEKIKIDVRLDMPGVGRNLQDRYELGVVAELSEDLSILKEAHFYAPGDPQDPQVGAPDPVLREWMNHRGVYASNGVTLTIIRRSKQAASDVPDLFLFGLPGNFRGYKPGYSRELQAQEQNGKWVENHRSFTWAILKGRTRNVGKDAGYVQLKSKDPLVRPEINFRYFDEGSPDWNKDMLALVEGVRLVQKIMGDPGLKAKVVWPKSEDLEEGRLQEFIKREAWGHHACGTCKIGKDGDQFAVLDGDFRVRGVQNLRVVDASVFPEIPGFFIISSIFMISEKASDVILRDHNPGPNDKVKPWPGPVVP